MAAQGRLFISLYPKHYPVRTHHYLLLIATAITACTKHESPATPSPIPISYKDTAAALPFYSTPLATDRLELTVPFYANIAKVYLKQDTTTLGTYTTTSEPYFFSHA